jgi:enoyl-CoA hydratase/carnithine racemase
MRTIGWDPESPLADQLKIWCAEGSAFDVLHVVFDGSGAEEYLGWTQIAPWTRTRVVTVAELRSSLCGAELAVALCADVVYLRRGVELQVDEAVPQPGLVWALGRAGRAALSRGLLDATAIDGREAVRLGLAQRVLDGREPVPVPSGASPVARATARDIMRTDVNSRSALELASFRLLFASGDPKEGADAFLERRDPVFDDLEG